MNFFRKSTRGGSCGAGPNLPCTSSDLERQKRGSLWLPALPPGVLVIPTWKSFSRLWPGFSKRHVPEQPSISQPQNVALPRWPHGDPAYSSGPRRCSLQRCAGPRHPCNEAIFRRISRIQFCGNLSPRGDGRGSFNWRVASSPTAPPVRGCRCSPRRSSALGPGALAEHGPRPQQSRDSTRTTRFASARFPHVHSALILTPSHLL